MEKSAIGTTNHVSYTRFELPPLSATKRNAVIAHSWVNPTVSAMESIIGNSHWATLASVLSADRFHPLRFAKTKNSLSARPLESPLGPQPMPLGSLTRGGLSFSVTYYQTLITLYTIHAIAWFVYTLWRNDFQELFLEMSGLIRYTKYTIRYTLYLSYGKYQ